MSTHPKHVYLRVVALLLPLLFAGAAAATHAAPPAPPKLEELKTQWWAERDPATLPPLAPNTAGGADAQTPEAGDALEDVSRIAYQSLRTGAWEVFIARGDGTQSQRLTNGGENTSPSLNRGATHVAFSSRRDGDQEIYSARTDGAELRRLTNSGGEDSWAAWSPDGRRIAFASTRNFSWDIFVMNADGSGQTRLTSTAVDDVTPTWSPDGQQIAWVQRDGDFGTLMVMNADGGQARPLTAPMRFLERPAWSPYGDRIAFDGDVDNDYWTELVTYELATGTLRRLHDGWLNGIDMWMGSWSPDSSYLAFNQIEYGVSNGELIITNSFIQRIASASGGSGQNLLSSGYDFFPSWQATDIAPPETRFQPLPRYVRVSVGTAFKIEWEGWDNGPAGIRDYLPQLWKEPAGGWQALPSTTQTWTYLSWQGDPAHTYAFRVRARDHAGNFGAWSGDSDDLFAPYIWRLDGRVHDSRGNDLDGAVVHPAPDTPDPATTTTPDGGFKLHISQYTQPTLVSLTREGYAQMPPKSFGGSNDYSDRPYWWDLRPQENRIEGGDFESASLSAWRLSGTAQTVLDQTDPHQGDSSASMGQPADLPVTRLSPPVSGGSGWLNPPHIARDAQGNLHVVWLEHGTEPAGILYALKTPTTTWTAPTVVTHTGSQPMLAAAPDGVLHVTMLVDLPGNSVAIYHTWKAPAGEWTEPAAISSAFRTTGTESHSLAADDLGAIHAAWSNGEDIWYAVLPAQGSWSQPARIFAGGRFPVLAAGPAHQLHLAYRSRTPPYSVLYSRDSDAASWLPAEQVPNSDGPNPPDLAVDLTGGLHLVALHQASAVYIARPAGREWQLPEPIGDQATDWITSFAVASAPDGAVHFLYTLRDRPNNFWSRIYYRVRNPGGAWSIPLRLSLSQRGYADGPDLVTDEGSRARTVWYNASSNNALENGVFYALVNPRRTYQASLEQTVDLRDLHAPTLSFAYKLAAPEESGASLSAAIDGVAVFSTTHPTAAWTHGWADLSPWAGQTVTVGFATQSTAASGPILANLDAVSVSAWLTPIIRRVAPSYLPPQTAIPITIHGENFVAPVSLFVNSAPLPVQRLDDQTLAATLPAALAPGSYDVQVRNAAGQSYTLRGGLRIGRQVFLPALLLSHERGASEP